ncbi:regulatory protein RecX [Acinetobacter sp. MD2(2019)]|uniref:regulatory protein RecX n=1 Tax=Acinetobacter sp. MD2(2019) TaxID=2605273 RepID=UPI002D1F1A3E|nr:regulatory protein RecX [Acinetobacter sp. MD2(2019)]MEB3754179.1 regulatory protein RecX [Acinetobacter sp. MD2(2019)]
MYKKSSPDALKTMTGARLRSYAFALLAKREYSKQELKNKLACYAQDLDEVHQLIEELEQQHYQSDERVAKMLLSSQIRQGKGPRRIAQALQKKALDPEYIETDLDDVDWLEQAYQLKIKKFGTTVSKDQKEIAKQVRYLQYRGYDMDVIFKAILKQENDLLE